MEPWWKCGPNQSPRAPRGLVLTHTHLFVFAFFFTVPLVPKRIDLTGHMFPMCFSGRKRRLRSEALRLCPARRRRRSWWTAAALAADLKRLVGDASKKDPKSVVFILVSL